MNRLTVVLIASTLFFTASASMAAENVVEDEGVGMSYEELEYLVNRWPENMQRDGANDMGDRLELLSMILGIKKMAAEADDILAKVDKEEYWKYTMALRNLKRRLVFDYHVNSIEIPDMEPLAQERYTTEKKKYAFVPERRLSSHILIMCPPGRCDRDSRRPDAEKVLAEVAAGGNFADLAAKYSEEPGASQRKGKFGTLLWKGVPNVSPPYVGAVFELDKVGDHSGLVETQFGFHIIQLDEIQPSYFKSYEDVKAQILADLEAEYVRLTMKNFESRYRITDKAYIDGEAVEKIFAPFRVDLMPAGSRGERMEVEDAAPAPAEADAKAAE